MTPTIIAYQRILQKLMMLCMIIQHLSDSWFSGCIQHFSIITNYCFSYKWAWVQQPWAGDPLFNEVKLSHIVLLFPQTNWDVQLLRKLQINKNCKILPETSLYWSCPWPLRYLAYCKNAAIDINLPSGKLT
jgi:hypothetical protein